MSHPRALPAGRIDHYEGWIVFLSIEPMIGPLCRLPLKGIDWVIVGGESGRRPREVRPEWVRRVRDECLGADVPFFFKQWGGMNKKRAGRMLDGEHWSQMPTPKRRSVSQRRAASVSSRASAP